MKLSLIVHLKASCGDGTCDASCSRVAPPVSGWGAGVGVVGGEVKSSYLHFDQAFDRLDLSFTEGPSVLCADVGPYSQVGWLIHRLQHTHTHTESTEPTPANTPTPTAITLVHQTAEQLIVGHCIKKGSEIQIINVQTHLEIPNTMIANMGCLTLVNVVTSIKIQTHISAGMKLRLMT